MKKRRSIVQTAGMAACWLTALAVPEGCTMAGDIRYDREGWVSIRPDRSVYPLPAMTWYFYGQDGGELRLTAAGDETGNFSGTLAEGTYRVIAVNAQTENVVYEGMEQTGTAVVSAADLTDGTSAALTAIYRVAVDGLRVDAGETLILYPQPTLLTREVTLLFTLEGDLPDRVTALSGMLGGVYPAVGLLSGNAPGRRAGQDLQAGYTATPREDGPGMWTASLTVFGLYDPNYGAHYRNVTAFTLTLDGTPEPVEADLTEEISRALEYYGGTLPAGVPLRLKINLTASTDNGVITIRAEVIPWVAEGSEQIEI